MTHNKFLPHTFADITILKNYVAEFILDNGLKLIIKTDKRAPVVASQIWCKVGSSYEYNGVFGISHALEHMMFRGSKKYSGDFYLRAISELGAKQNAFTAYDYTTYHCMFPTTKLSQILDLEVDRFQHLLLREEDFKLEKNIIIEERNLRIEDNPERIAQERFLAAAYITNPYRHPVIGWHEDIKNLTLANARNWYDTWYAPNNIIFVIAGDVEPDKTFHLVERLFSSLIPKEIKEPRKDYRLPEIGPRQVEVNLPAKLPHILLGFNTPVLNTAPEHWEAYALLILSTLLGWGKGARLYQSLVHNKKIASHVAIHYTPYDRMDNVLFIRATPMTKEDTTKIPNALFHEIDLFKNELITKTEIQRAVNQLIANKIYNFDSIFNQAYELGSLEAVGISWHELDEEIQHILSITAEQIQTVAQKYLTEQRSTLTILKPIER